MWLPVLHPCCLLLRLNWWSLWCLWCLFTVRAACATSSTGVVSVDPAVVVTFTCFSTVVSSLPLAVLCSLPQYHLCLHLYQIGRYSYRCPDCMPAPLRVHISIPVPLSYMAVSAESTSTFSRSTFTPSAVTKSASAVSADMAWSMACCRLRQPSAVRLSMEIFSSSPA